MAVLLRGGAIFLHIPKTGGNWVTRVLDDAGVIEMRFGHKHLDLPGVMRFEHYLLDANRWNESPYRPFRFCFVRHPMRWYESWWRMMEGLGWPAWGREGCLEEWHPNAVLNGLGDPNFNRFVENVLLKRPGYVTELYGHYTDSAIDYIGRQEKLVDDLLDLLALLEMQVDSDAIRSTQHVNVSDPAMFIKWDPDLRREVEKTEYAGLCRYGYQ